MGLLRSLAMLSLMMLFLWLPGCTSQSPETPTMSAGSLDVLLQDYAYRAFVRPRTGISYKGNVPSNLTGVRVEAMRLRSGSLRTKGVKTYNEFDIPKGVVVSPFVERLVLVYQNLGNWSEVYYPLDGYTYLTPMLGLLAYDASNLSATNLPELDINASGGPISIKFSDIKLVPDGLVAKCVWFDLQGMVNFNNVVSANACSTIKQGHFSIAVESTAPSPSPFPEPPKPGGKGPKVGPKPKGKKEDNSKIWILVGSVLGGFILLVLLGLLVLCANKYKRQKKMKNMEREAEVGEALRMTSVGNTKAPSAMVTRTQPTIENEYVP